MVYILGMLDFEKFPVYKKSEEFLIAIQSILTNYSIELHMRDQLNRASSSISLNVAEGAGKSTKPDKKTTISLPEDLHMSVLVLREFSIYRIKCLTSSLKFYTKL